MSFFEEEIRPHLEGDDPAFGGIEAETLVGWAKEVGGSLSPNNNREGSLKNHQLRKFYDTVKQIERGTLQYKPDHTLSEDLVAQLLFLRPHLANAQRKDRNIKPLRDALEPCLRSDVIKKKKDLTRFVKFFEAIVAYTGQEN